MTNAIDVFYYTWTGNCRRFLEKSGVPHTEISPEASATRPFVLVTSTLGFGEVPEPVVEFLKRNYTQLVGVAVSGNRNWGVNFAKAGDIIAQQYDVPLLLKFELSGTKRDVATFNERLCEIGDTYRIKQ